MKNTKQENVASIIIEGTKSGRLGFHLPVTLNCKEDDIEIESALAKHFDSQAASFSELCVEQGWFDCYWTYSNEA